MPLGVIPMIYFGILSKNWNLGISGPYAAAWDASQRRGRGAQKGIPRVRYNVALLRSSGVLRRNVVVLRRCIDTVHN